MTIAVTGATGQLGRIVIQKLLEKVPAIDIVALVRNPAKAVDLGVNARAADYAQPEALAEALKGVDKLLLISSSEVGQRAQQHKNVIAAAKQAGVKEVVYTSLLHADASTLDLAIEHRITEADIKASGIPYVILRNGWYTENLTGSIGGALAGGAVLDSAGDGKFSSASRADYAQAAVNVLTSAGHTGKTYELAGDQAYTLTDYAAEIAKQSGKNVAYKNLSVDEYAAILAQYGLDAGFAKVIAGWGPEIAKGALFAEDRTLSTLIGRPTTPLSESVTQALKAAV